MAIEKNLVFIHPIAPVLKKILEQLEDADEYIIYEMDSLDEYKQLIGILEHVITFSSDMKKTSRYLQINKNFIRSKTSLNIVVTSSMIPPHISRRLSKFGLDDILKESIREKSLFLKIERFFQKFETNKDKEIEEKQKNMNQEVFSMNKDSKKESIDTESKQHIERMTLDEQGNQRGQDLKRKKVDLSGIQIGGNSFNNLQGKLDAEPQTKGILRKKALTKLNLPEIKDKLKSRPSFTPAEKDLKRKKHAQFKEVERQFDHKTLRGQDDKVTPAKKKGKFEEVQRQFEHKTLKTEDEKDPLQKKKGNFKEVDRQFEHKTLDTQDNEKTSPKKKGSFEEVKRQYDHKSLKTDEDEDSARKKRGTFEEFQKDKKKKNLTFEPVKRETKWNKAENELDLNKKKKRSKIFDLEKEPRKRKKQQAEYLSTHYNYKKSQNFAEKRNTSFGKLENIEEISRDKDLNVLKKEGDKSEYDEKVLRHSKKDWGEQTLDYAQMRKEHKNSKEQDKEKKEILRQRQRADQITNMQDTTYFFPKAQFAQYFIHLESQYLNYDINPQQYLKFIHFVLIKNFEAVVSFYTFKDDKLFPIYIGHEKVSMSEFNLDIWENIHLQVLDEIKDIELSTWEDDKFAGQYNRLVFPYYAHSEKKAVALIHFKKTIKNNEQAELIETFLSCAKGLFRDLKGGL